MSVFRGMDQDQVFIYKLMLRMLVHIDAGHLDRYCQHPDSHRRKSARLEQTERKRGLSQCEFIFLNWLQGYLFEQNLRAHGVWGALKQQLWRYKHPQLYQIQSLSRRFWATG